jgi:hypothetical protein
LQTDRINAALKPLSSDESEAVLRFLRGMIDHDEPDKVLDILLGPRGAIAKE